MEINREPYVESMSVVLVKWIYACLLTETNYERCISRTAFSFTVDANILLEKQPRMLLVQIVDHAGNNSAERKSVAIVSSLRMNDVAMSYVYERA